MWHNILARTKTFLHVLCAFLGLSITIWILHDAVETSTNVQLDARLNRQAESRSCLTAINSTQVVSICPPETRLTELQERCRLRRPVLRNPSLVYRQILVDDRHKLLVCMVPKAASTSIYNLIYTTITGKVLKEPHCQPCWEKEGLLPLNKFNQSDIQHKLHNYLKVMVTRHPIDRLHSCWNHKFRRNNASLRMKRPGERLLKYLRKLNATEQLATMEISFADVVRLVQVYEERPELVHNLHWMPITDLCDPCTIQYDRFIRVESLFKDSKVITDRLNIRHNQFPHMNNFQGLDSNVLVPVEISEFSDLPQKLQNIVMEIYREDFRLFGYGWQTPNATCDGYNNENQKCC